MIIRIYANGKTELVHKTWKGEIPLETLQNWVDGYIEIVRVYWLGKPAQMIVDEESLLKDKAFNPIGYGLYTAMALQNGFPLEQASHPIVGDVVLLTDEDLLK